MYKIHLKRKIILFVDFGSLKRKSIFYQLSCYQHAKRIQGAFYKVAVAMVTAICN